MPSPPLQRPSGPAGRLAAVAGALLFGASLLYFLATYHGRFAEPAGAWSARGWSPATFDALLFSAFALHHSIFARGGLKGVITRWVPAPLERVAYVWLSSLLFLAVCWWWRPVPGVAWTWPDDWVPVSIGLQIAGAVITLAAARRVDVVDLAGLRQPFGWARRARPLETRGLYGLVRHPIYLGWVLLVWPVATMTGTRLVMAAISTAYLMAAVPFEERDLERTFGGAYGHDRHRVRWRMLPFLY